MRRRFYDFNNRFRTTKNTEAIVFDSDYTHLFGYLNPYYRTAYSIPKRKR